MMFLMLKSNPSPDDTRATGAFCALAIVASDRAANAVMKSVRIDDITQSPATGMRATNGTSVEIAGVTPRAMPHQLRALSARITITANRKNAATAASR